MYLFLIFLFICKLGGVRNFRALHLYVILLRHIIITYKYYYVYFWTLAELTWLLMIMNNEANTKLWDARDKLSQKLQMNMKLVMT